MGKNIGIILGGGSGERFWKNVSDESKKTTKEKISAKKSLLKERESIKKSIDKEILSKNFVSTDVEYEYFEDSEFLKGSLCIQDFVDKKLPKQFQSVDNIEIISYSIIKFMVHEKINEIIVVVPKKQKKFAEKMIGNLITRKKIKIICGGKSRAESTMNALKEIKGKTDNLIFHDAARPNFNPKLIDDCINALKKYNAVSVSFELSDTVVEANKKNELVKIPRRDNLRRLQTPQAFKSGTIKNAYKKAIDSKKPIKNTDDTGVVLNYLPKEQIKLIEGHEDNIKITYKRDLEVFRGIIEKKKRK